MTCAEAMEFTAEKGRYPAGMTGFDVDALRDREERQARCLATSRADTCWDPDDCRACAGTGGYPDEPDCPSCAGTGRSGGSHRKDR